MRKHLRATVGFGLIASWCVLAFACAVDDSNPVVPRRQIEGGAFAGDATELVDAPNGVPICAIYGGVANARSIALAVLTATKDDCRIKTTLDTTQTDGHAIQCFQAFVAASFQCDGASLATGYADDDGVPCSRPIDDILSDLDFDTFIAHYRTILGDKALRPEDIAAVVAALEATRVQVVGEDVPDGKYTQCAAACSEAGAACVRPKDAGVRDAAPDARDAAPDARDAAPDARDAAPDARDAAPDARDATIKDALTDG